MNGNVETTCWTSAEEARGGGRVELRREFRVKRHEKLTGSRFDVASKFRCTGDRSCPRARRLLWKRGVARRRTGGHTKEKGTQRPGAEDGPESSLSLLTTARQIRILRASNPPLPVASANLARPFFVRFIAI